MVVNINDSAVGLVVDTVSEVVDIPESQIESASGLNRSKSNAFIQGIGKIGDDIKIILDVNKLLFEGDIISMNIAANAV